MPALVAVCTGILIVLLINIIKTAMTRKNRRVRERLGHTLGPKEKKEVSRETGFRPRHLTAWLGKIPLFGAGVGRRYLEKLNDNLVKAGVPLKPEELAAMKLLSALIVFFLSIFLFHLLPAALVLGVLGFFLPYLWVQYLKKRRVILLESQLLDAVVLMANSLRAGHSFLQAMELVSRETRPPLAEEFKRVIRETRLGVPVEEALVNLGQRVDSKEMELVVTGVLVQREVGGNLAEILDHISNTIEKRIKMRAKIRALTAQGRMSAWIISLLPIFLAFFIFSTQPDMGRLMVTEPLGVVMLVVGIIMLVLGILVIRKVVDIDV